MYSLQEKTRYPQRTFFPFMHIILNDIRSLLPAFNAYLPPRACRDLRSGMRFNRPLLDLCILQSSLTLPVKKQRFTQYNVKPYECPRYFNVGSRPSQRKG